MELKKRETIENVNFNKKGEKIENSFFEDEEKKDENDSEQTVAANSDENVQKEVSVSNKPDSTISIANGSPLEDHERTRKIKIWKNILIFGGSFGLVLLFVGAYFGLEAKDIYLTKVPLEEILKGNAQAVFSINSNTDFQQYKYLDDNLRKFPGYKLIEKELDDVGEGKSVSEAFQDKLASKNLSFNEDIKPVIGDKTLVVIPTLVPLTNEFQKMVFDNGKKAKNALRKMELEGKIANVDNALVEGDITGAGKIKVLGMTSDFYTSGVGVEEKAPEPVDFIIGANIKSLKEAKRVLDKLKSDRNKYEISEIKFEGYTYYKVTQKNQKTDEYSQLMTSINDTYHALIGHNWIMATSETDLKEMISSRKSNHILSKMSFWKKSKEKMISLKDDNNYNDIEKNLAIQSQNGFASVYLRTNLNNLVPSEYPESQSGKIFKSQEGDLIMGILLRATPEGIVLRTSTNQVDLSSIENMPVEEGLIQQMPARADGRWTDFYSETANLKNSYYSLKRNNLTEEGLKMFNEAREEIKQQIGLDPETDFIDHFNGNGAVAGFTAAGMSPQGAVIIEIDNEDAILESTKKIIELVKGIEMMPYQMLMSQEASFGNEQKTIDDTEANQGMNGVDNPYIATRNSYYSPEKQAEYAEKFRLIQEAQLVQVQTDAGPIYSYQIPSVEGVSFNLAFSDNKMIIGTDQGVVVDLIKDLGVGNTAKLTSANDFENIVKNIYPKGYSKVFIKPLGIWNGISYYMGQIGANMGMQREEDQEMISAVGTVFRTINLISGIQTASPATEAKSIGKSAIFVEIKEVSPEEKENAERILEKY